MIEKRISGPVYSSVVVDALNGDGTFNWQHYALTGSSVGYRMRMWRCPTSPYFDPPDGEDFQTWESSFVSQAASWPEGTPIAIGNEPFVPAQDGWALNDPLGLADEFDRIMTRLEAVGDFNFIIGNFLTPVNNYFQASRIETVMNKIISDYADGRNLFFGFHPYLYGGAKIDTQQELDIALAQVDTTIRWARSFPMRLYATEWGILASWGLGTSPYWESFLTGCWDLFEMHNLVGASYYLGSSTPGTYPTSAPWANADQTLPQYVAANTPLTWLASVSDYRKSPAETLLLGPGNVVKDLRVPLLIGLILWRLG